jgi:hypothetical protein
LCKFLTDVNQGINGPVCDYSWVKQEDDDELSDGDMFESFCGLVLKEILYVHIMMARLRTQLWKGNLWKAIAKTGSKNDVHQSRGNIGWWMTTLKMQQSAKNEANNNSHGRPVQNDENYSNGLLFLTTKQQITPHWTRIQLL